MDSTSITVLHSSQMILLIRSTFIFGIVSFAIFSKLPRIYRIRIYTSWWVLPMVNSKVEIMSMKIFHVACLWCIYLDDIRLDSWQFSWETFRILAASNSKYDALEIFIESLKLENTRVEVGWVGWFGENKILWESRLLLTGLIKTICKVILFAPYLLMWHRV